MIVDQLVLSRAEDESRLELIDSLKAAADAARSIAGRNQERRRADALARADRLDRIVDFLANGSALPDAADKALCDQVREKLKARGEW